MPAARMKVTMKNDTGTGGGKGDETTDFLSNGADIQGRGRCEEGDHLFHKWNVRGRIVASSNCELMQ